MTTDPSRMTKQELIDALAAAQAKRSGAAPRMSLKVSAKGAVSVYGMGRFPVTLYKSQWERLLEFAPQVADFIAANVDKLAVKE